MPDAMLNTPIRTTKNYNSWSEFKIALEARMGRPLPLVWWLRIKPQNPMPWDETDLRISLCEVLRIQETFNYKPVHFRRY